MALFALAQVGSREVHALGSHVTWLKRLGTFVDVDTGLAVSFEPSVASTLVSTDSVGAGGVLVALVRLGRALVDIFTLVGAVTGETILALALVRAGSVGAFGVGMALVELAVSALVDVHARGAVTVETGLALALVVAGRVSADGVGATLVRVGFAFVNVHTGRAVTLVPSVANTRAPGISVRAGGVLVAVVAGVGGGGRGGSGLGSGVFTCHSGQNGSGYCAWFSVRT